MKEVLMKVQVKQRQTLKLILEMTQGPKAKVMVVIVPKTTTHPMNSTFLKNQS